MSMDKGDIEFFLGIIETMKKELKTDITQFKIEAHDLLKDSMKRIESVVVKLNRICNDHDDRIDKIEYKLEHIELDKQTIDALREKRIKNTFLIGIEVLKGWVFPIAVILTLIWFGVK